MKRVAPAVARNRDPILAVLLRELPAEGLVLELASGSGEHAIHFAAGLPHLSWQPSDPDPGACASIAAYQAEAALPNLRPPLALDVEAPWPVARAAAIVCVNMIHIAPWSATLALFAGAARCLDAGAPLITYGPYAFAGRHVSESNVEFDASLRARDPRWGVRDVDALDAVAAAAGFARAATIAMPANNHTLVWRAR